ncbi:MAG: hypothetical protein ACI8X5_002703 [Planctomycetota bacterium]|jgi:hypothetical protein
MKEQRGLRSQLQRLVLPIVAYSAMAVMVGCGHTSSSSSGPPPNAPAVSGVLPPNGSPNGGTLVTLTGTGFEENVSGATIVTFAGLPATDVVVVDDSTITALTPAHVNNTQVNVEVSNSRGVGILMSGYQYLATAGMLSDLNSDGIPDIVIAASKDAGVGVSAGAVFVFYGSDDSAAVSSQVAADADVVIAGAAEGDRLGTALVTGDINGDGHTDLIIGVPFSDNVAENAGEVLVFLGPLPDSAVMGASSADIILGGEGTVAGAWYGIQGDVFGAALALGDANEDGVIDLLVGAPGVDLNVGESNEIEDAGRIYLFSGGDALVSGSASGAASMVDGVKDFDQLGSDVCIVDLNADGRPDLAASYDVMLSGPNHSGKVAIFTSEGQATTTTDSAEIVLKSSENGDRFGFTLTCADINGDGAEDLLVGAPYSNSFSSASGRVYAFLGSEDFAGGIVQNTSDAIFTGQLSNTNFGSELASADVNGDGYDDVMVGAPFTTATATWDGQVFVFFGAEVPADSVAYSSDVILTGESIAGERFGSAIEVLDSDMDGIADIMSGATGHADLAGRVYVFNGKEAIVDTDAVDGDLILSGQSEGGSFGSSISQGR